MARSTLARARGVMMGFLLLAFTGLGSAMNQEGHAYLDSNGQKDGVTVLPSGLQYQILRSGPAEGSPPKATSDVCTCHYTGKLTDGTVFDSSVERGTPTSFSPAGVIGGWTKALMLMRPGNKWILSIPSDLGISHTHTSISISVSLPHSRQSQSHSKSQSPSHSHSDSLPLTLSSKSQSPSPSPSHSLTLTSL